MAKRYKVGMAVALLSGLAAVAITGLSGLSEQASAQAIAVSTSDSCDSLGHLTLRNVTIASATHIAQNDQVPSSDFLPMFGKMKSVARGLPAFCRITGRIAPEAGSNIGFEIWLPQHARWDGRLHGIGVGGFAGVIDYHGLSQAIKAGQVGVATNTGHTGGMQDYSWAKDHPQKVRDYSWRAIHLTTVAAKQIVMANYGRKPDKSYFVGCSGGGRQGLVQAARFPNDYDGILAGAPAANFTNLAMALTHATQAQLSPGAAIRHDQAKFLQAEVLKQCDAQDGQSDGLVDNPRQCKFDASKLSCSSSASAQCFTDPQISALQRIQAGPRTSGERQLAGGYLPSGSEAGDPSPFLGWEGYLLMNANGQSGGRGLADGMLGALIQKPFATVENFDFDKHPALLRAASREIDAPTNLRRFFARGGKLILWHGWADAAIPPEATLQYHSDMMRLSGKKAAGSARLFMVPGVQHCTGGLGPDAFGQSGAPQAGDTPERSMVAALQSWTEGNRSAPEEFTGRRGHGDMMRMMGGAEAKQERQRLLCAWPKRAVLRAGQDPDNAASYSCN